MKTIIEVGANHGDDTERLSEGGKNKVYAFEPTPELIYKLHERFAGRENIYIVPMAVDEHPGWRWFNVTQTPDRGASSLYDFERSIAKKFDDPAFKHGKRYRVMVTTLDKFLSANNILAVDFLWIDAQGNDFAVLRSLGFLTDRIREGKCEATYNDKLYEGTDNHYRKIVAWLKDHGFETRVVPNASLAECDIHFRPKPRNRLI